MEKVCIQSYKLGSVGRNSSQKKKKKNGIITSKLMCQLVITKQKIMLGKLPISLHKSYKPISH